MFSLYNYNVLQPYLLLQVEPVLCLVYQQQMKQYTCTNPDLFFQQIGSLNPKQQHCIQVNKNKTELHLSLDSVNYKCEKSEVIFSFYSVVQSFILGLACTVPGLPTKNETSETTVQYTEFTQSQFLQYCSLHLKPFKTI